MKNGLAVVIGALVMFVSGYLLGYTTAVPDMMRASSGVPLQDDALTFDTEIKLDAEPADADQDPDGLAPDGAEGLEDVLEQGSADDQQITSFELDALKKMIVPLLTDEEIKQIRDEVAAKAKQENPD